MNLAAGWEKKSDRAIWFVFSVFIVLLILTLFREPFYAKSIFRKREKNMQLTLGMNEFSCSLGLPADNKEIGKLR